MASDLVDDLLAHYLGLLDEYVRLRHLLASRQASLYGHLARANFAAERGFRYGPDHFDGRMQAAVRVSISMSSNALGVSAGVGAGAGAGVGVAAAAPTPQDVPSFSIVRTPWKTRQAAPEKSSKAEQGPGEDTEVRQDRNKSAELGTETLETKEAEETSEQKDGHSGSGPATADKAATASASSSLSPPPPKNPLQWFGILTPMALRQAQADAIEVVDAIVARLASVNAEMAAVEIEVRRARKKRARAAAAEHKVSREQQEQRNQPALPSAVTHG